MPLDLSWGNYLTLRKEIQNVTEIWKFVEPSIYHNVLTLQFLLLVILLLS